MSLLPNPDEWERDITELPPAQAKERVESGVHLTVGELRELKETQRFEEYNDRASGQETDDPPIPGGPTEDVIHLMTTPAEEWGDDEMAEADEWANYASRTIPQYDETEGEPLLPEQNPDIHKGEMALLTWGLQPEPESDNFL